MRPANVIVKVTDGHDRGELDFALRLLKKKMAMVGMFSLLKHTSRLFAFTPPSKRRREKAAAARKRARRREARRTQYEDFRDRGGDRRAAHQNADNDQHRRQSAKRRLAVRRRRSRPGRPSSARFTRCSSPSTSMRGGAGGWSSRR